MALMMLTLHCLVAECMLTLAKPKEIALHSTH